MIKTYKTFCFENEPDFSLVPKEKIDFFNWEEAEPYRPQSWFQMCFVQSKGVYIKMQTDETSLRTKCKGRDENCWEDSCMEFFFKPFSNKDEYLNFEMTAAGAYLSAFGSGRENRIFIKSLTPIEPKLKTEIHSNGWNLELFIPCSLFKEVYGQKFEACAGQYKGNFFKCGDKTQAPHFASFSPMGTLPPGFHNSSLFAFFEVEDFPQQ